MKNALRGLGKGAQAHSTSSEQQEAGRQSLR